MRAAEAVPQMDRAKSHLREALARERTFARARAAEVMLWSGIDVAVVRAGFLREAEAPEAKWRVVVWRVLAQCAADAAERGRWEGLIRAAAIAPDGPDRTHGIEAWAKLKLAGRPDGLVAAAACPGDEQAFARWALTAGGDAEDEARLVELLVSDRPQTRMVAAYAACFLPRGRAATAATVSSALAAAREDAPLRSFLIAAAHVHAERVETMRAALEGCLRRATSEQSTMALTALSLRPDPALTPLAASLLASSDVDLRTRAAHAVLVAGASG